MVFLHFFSLVSSVHHSRNEEWREGKNWADVGKNWRQSSNQPDSLPALIKLAIERSSTQSRNGIQPLESPTHAGSFGSRGPRSFACRFGSAAAQMHSLCAKSREAHPMHVRTEVLGFCFQQAAGLPRLRCRGRERFDRRNHLFSLTLRAHVTDGFRPGRARGSGSAAKAARATFQACSRA